MKILKPGKVEQVKLTCPKCGCIFVALKRTEMLHNLATKKYDAFCPQTGCKNMFSLDEGELDYYVDPVPDEEEAHA